MCLQIDVTLLAAQPRPAPKHARGQEIAELKRRLEEQEEELKRTKQAPRNRRDLRRLGSWDGKSTRWWLSTKKANEAKELI